MNLACFAALTVELAQNPPDPTAVLQRYGLESCSTLRHEEDQRAKRGVASPRGAAYQPHPRACGVPARLNTATPELAGLDPPGAEPPPGAESSALPKARPPLLSESSTISLSSPGRGRTDTPSRAVDFKSTAYAIPPRGQSH